MTERVRQAMTPAPATIGADEYVVEAARLMATHDVGSLPVVDDGKLVGVLSQADVALEGKDKEVGDVVQEISQPTSAPRES